MTTQPSEQKVPSTRKKKAHKADLHVQSLSQEIQDYCKSLFGIPPDLPEDPAVMECNFFVQKVELKFERAIPKGKADDIVGAFSNKKFFTDTTTEPTKAMEWAATNLVVAGMTAKDLGADFGHVAIVHPIPTPGRPNFPMASWGRHGGGGRYCQSIRESFPASLCDAKKVQFAIAAKKE